MSSGDLARAAFLRHYAQFNELEELNVRLVAVEARGNGTREEREDLRRDLDRRRLVVTLDLLLAFFAMDDTDPRSY
jgi:hypothetical protein